MTDTNLLLLILIGLVFFLAYRLGTILARLDSLAEMTGDFFRAILDELKKDGKK
jgi:hypothetical protein